MNIRFNIKGNCEVKNAGAYPSKEDLEQMLEDCLKQEMGIDADISVSEYRQCNF